MILIVINSDYNYIIKIIIIKFNVISCRSNWTTTSLLVLGLQWWVISTVHSMSINYSASVKTRLRRVTFKFNF